MVKKTERRIRTIKKFAPLFLMMLPGLFYLLINNYLPMFGLVTAFKNVNYAKGVWASDWVGFDNFEFLFRTKDAYLITRNTVLYNGAFIALNTIIAVFAAIVLNAIRSRFFARLYQSVILIPYLISMVIVSYLVMGFLSTESGLMNKAILPLFGVDPVSWYSSPEYWPYILTAVNLWKNIGFLTVIYLAAIIGIDQEYYEAARLDGAGRWQQARSITIPLIMPVVIMMTLLAVGKIFYSDFGLFYQVPLDSGALYKTTNVIDTFVFRSLIKLGDVGMSSAAGFYQSVVGFALVLVSNGLVRKINKENALF